MSAMGGKRTFAVPLPGREGLGVGARSAPCYAGAMARRVKPEDTERARLLRNNATPEERQVWRMISRYSDVRDNPVGTAEAIIARAAECLGGTHPQPLPSREGRTRRAHRR